MKSRILYFLALIITSSLLFSCDDDAKGPVYELKGGRDYVSFLSSAQTNEIIDENKVNVYIGHANKNAKSTVAKVSIASVEGGSEGLFRLASSEITFGSNSLISVEILFDIEDLEFNYDYILTLSLADDESDYPLGTDIKETTVNIKRVLTFNEYGTGIFISEFDEAEWEQEILLAEEALVFRLPDLYEEGYPMDIAVNEDGSVTISYQPAWLYDDDYGLVYVIGSGIMEDGVITMQIEHYLPSIDYSFGTYEEVLILDE